ncbi:MAG: HAMP domain-containing protein, partial [Gemmatimonadaceae bacterium]|nr:HAMP domain-containing protein [Acetobacteraceae bacterium]
RPLGRLAEAADRLGRGERVDSLPESGPEETRRTVRAFNLMHERLDRFVRDRMTMLAAMAHDLRTPITTLRLRAEFIDDEEMRTKTIATLDEMQAMAEATLAFAQVDAAGEPTRATDIAALVESVVEDLAAQALDVTLAGQADRLVLPCRPLALRRALINVVENANRYGGAARVSVARDDRSVRICVDDRGPGIAEAELERVFEPFVRLEHSRNRETGGAGLGLAIARSVVRAHGGNLWLENRSEGGLRATIALPYPS